MNRIRSQWPWLGLTLVLTVLAVSTATAATSPARIIAKEVYHYHETTGKQEKSVEWRLKQADNVFYRFEGPGGPPGTP